MSKKIIIKNFIVYAFTAVSILITAEIFAQTALPHGIVYSESKNRQTNIIQAPDGSLKAKFNNYAGRAVEISINGNWNRLQHDIILNDVQHTAYPFDFIFGTYTDLITNDMRPVYDISNISESHLQMRAQAILADADISIVRDIVFSDQGRITEKLILSNISAHNVEFDFGGVAFTFASLFDFTRISSNNNNILSYRYFDAKLKKAKFKSLGATGLANAMAFVPYPQWLTISDNFFINIIRPSESRTMAVYNAFDSGSKKRVGTGVQVLATNIPAYGTLEFGLEYYLGPMQENIITSIDKNYNKLFAWPGIFNWFMKPIEKATVWFLDFMLQKTGSAGLMLVLIALAVKLLLLPLSIKSAISMKKMRLLQPRLNKLQEKWGSDPQILQQKTMELYKQEKANPLGGCLPLLLQIPVFFVLFRVLSRSVALRGAGFLWMKDLTLPDSLFMIGSFHFNLLPIIMTLLQLVSVLLQQGRMTSQNEMQKQMQMQSYLMPVMFLFLFWNMPSGLVLYWTVQNIFSIIEQEFINLDDRLGKK